MHRLPGLAAVCCLSVLLGACGRVAVAPLPNATEATSSAAAPTPVGAPAASAVSDSPTTPQPATPPPSAAPAVAAVPAAAKPTSEPAAPLPAIVPPTAAAPATHSTSLSWTSPTENTDGSVLSDLSGYHIYYGTDRTQLTNVVDVPGIGVQTYVVDNLASGTWYFSIAAYNSRNTDGDFSNLVIRSF
jgi:hypothetical protein